MSGYQPDWTNDGFEPEVAAPLREALLWHEILSSGDVPPDRRDAFETWLHENPDNARAYSEVDSIWTGASQLPQLAELRQRNRTQMTRRMFLTAGLAATGAAGGGLWMSGHPFADIRTAKGELRQMTLDEGSQIELAGGTAASFDLSDQRRNILLHRGEVWADMSETSGISFLVSRGQWRIDAPGSQFTLEIGSGGQFLTVAGHEAILRSRHTEMIVSSGQQVRFDTHSTQIADVDPSQSQAWRDGRLVYVSQPVSRIIAGINRWSDQQIIVLDGTLKQRLATLLVDIAHIETALDHLQKAVPMRRIEAPGKYVFIT